MSAPEARKLDYYWTFIVAWPRFAPGPYGQELEEIDVEGVDDEAVARARCLEILAEQYEAGGKIVEYDRRYYGIIYF